MRFPKQTKFCLAVCVDKSFSKQSDVYLAFARPSHWFEMTIFGLRGVPIDREQVKTAYRSQQLHVYFFSRKTRVLPPEEENKLYYILSYYHIAPDTSKCIRINWLQQVFFRTVMHRWTESLVCFKNDFGWILAKFNWLISCIAKERHWTLPPVWSKPLTSKPLISRNDYYPLLFLFRSRNCRLLTVSCELVWLWAKIYFKNKLFNRLSRRFCFIRM